MGLINSKNNFPFQLSFAYNMPLTSGVLPTINIPLNLQNSLNYALIDNRNSTATVNIFVQGSDVLHGTPNYIINPLEARTIYLTGLLNQGFVVTYSASAATNKNLQIYLGDTDFGINNISGANVTPGVLAQAAQLPAALSGAGNLKVDLAEAGQLPSALSANGNLKVDLVESLPQPPEPCNFIQSFTEPANTALSIVQSAVALKTIFVSGFSVNVQASAIGASDVIVQILDGVTVIFTDIIPTLAARGYKIAYDFSKPIPCTVGNSCTLKTTISGGGTTVLCGNIYGTQK